MANANKKFIPTIMGLLLAIIKLAYLLFRALVSGICYPFKRKSTETAWKYKRVEFSVEEDESPNILTDEEISSLLTRV
jgi:hypothetical protein